MENVPPSALDLVYAARSPQELADAYRAWAQSYDRETLELGYCLPFVIAGWLSRHVPAGEAEILDAGCGTGLSGPVLQALGYSNLTGLDFSPDMLKAAKARGGYNRLVEAELGKILPFETGRFAAFVSTGVFTAGHAPATSLQELVRILKPGGHAIFTVRTSIYDSGGFRDVIGSMTKRSIWLPVEASEPFRAFAIGEPDVLVGAYVFRKC